MELSAFSENIVTEKFARNGEEVELQINIDALTPEYLEHMDAALNAVFKQAEKRIKRSSAKKAQESSLELEKDLLILQREVHASFLTDPISLPTGGTTSLLKGWDLVDHGEPVACNKSSLMRLPPKAVEALCQFCIDRAKTVKKREDVEIEATLENTPSGSRALRAVGQNT
jgi:hypothetical protein